MVDVREVPPPLALRGVIWLLERLMPREGWLSFLLLIVVIVGISNAILETEWVPTIGLIWLNGVVAAFLATLFAKHIQSERQAWFLLAISGVLFTCVRVGGLIPPLATWRDGSWDEAFIIQGSLFLERLTAWWTQLQTGNSSTETLPFLLGVGMAIWLLAALLAWQTYRTRRPLPALTLICFGVAMVGYFSRSPLHWLLQVVMGAIALAALMRFVRLQMAWEAEGVDYPANVLYDVAVAVALFAILFPLLGYVMPRIALPTVARAFAASPPVQAVEGVLERAFGGVDVQRGGRGAAGQSVGVMPRQHLLTGTPELLQSIVMTATIAGDRSATHWRALSYDNYTGGGWEASAENQTTVPANTSIPHPEILATASSIQTVYWLQDNRSTRYSLGRPAQFDQETRLQWHGRSDLVRVRGEGTIYQVQTDVSVATGEMLAGVVSADVPNAMRGRYTQLPDTIPQRVLDLAESVTADAATPYAKAKALESFLRQYEYSLDVNAPPADQDVVDFFLFEQQVGYCDYYATAMTVMARHIGLPARMAIGFAAAPTIDGTQELRGIDAHSWTEIHFGDYGWIEFEPTGGFALPRSGGVETGALEPIPTEPLPIPERPTSRVQIVVLVTVAFFIVTLIVFIVWRSLLPAQLPDIVLRYDQLQQHAAQLNVPLSDNQTPLEFLAQFDQRIEAFGKLNWVKRRPRVVQQLAKIQQTAHTLTSDFVQTQYDEAPPTSTLPAQTWQRTRRLLWLLQGSLLFGERKT